MVKKEEALRKSILKTRFGRDLFERGFTLCKKCLISFERSGLEIVSVWEGLDDKIHLGFWAVKFYGFMFDDGPFVIHFEDRSQEMVPCLCGLSFEAMRADPKLSLGSFPSLSDFVRCDVNRFLEWVWNRFRDRVIHNIYEDCLILTADLKLKTLYSEFILES